MSVTTESSVDADQAVSDLVQAVVSALAGAGVAGLVAGPGGAQESVQELVPPGDGVAAAAQMPGVGIVTVLFAGAHASRLDASGGSWTAVVEPAVQAWARSRASTVDPFTPAVSSASVSQLLPQSEGLRLTAAGIFEGDQHVGTVALVLGPEAPDSANGTQPDAAAAPPGAADSGSAQPAPSEQQTPEPAAHHSAGSVEPDGLHALAAVEMSVTAELGRTTMAVSELLDLAPGSLIELNRQAGSPIDVLVNGTRIACGEVVVINEEFGLRITEVIRPDEAST